MGCCGGLNEKVARGHIWQPFLGHRLRGLPEITECVLGASFVPS